jgi:hypothetical protein
MFAALHRDEGTAAELARVLAAWLIVVLLLQGLAALQTLVRGPVHRHAPGASVWPSPTQAGPAARAWAHAEAHRRGDAHHHAAGDPVPLPADGEAALDTAACVLLAVLAPLAASLAWLLCGVRAAPAATAPWAWLDHRPVPPRPPPRG